MRFFPRCWTASTFFLSSEDIRKGAGWLSKIREELEATDFGLLCLTREALTSPWLLFEAGALAKRVAEGHVVPLYLGIASADVEPPLGSFQGMPPDELSFRKLLREINSAPGGKAWHEDRLSKRFDKWWPELEKAVAAVLAEVRAPCSPVPQRDLREVVAEILDLVRSYGTKRERLDAALMALARTSPNARATLGGYLHPAALHDTGHPGPGLPPTSGLG